MGRGKDLKPRRKAKPRDYYTRRVLFDHNNNVRKLTLPFQLCDELGIHQGDAVDIRKLGSCVVITKLEDNNADRKTEENG